MAESQQPPQCAAVSCFLKMTFSMTLKVIYANCRKSGKLKRKEKNASRLEYARDSPHDCGGSSGLLLLWESQQSGRRAAQAPEATSPFSRLLIVRAPVYLCCLRAGLAVVCKGHGCHRASSACSPADPHPAWRKLGHLAPSSLEPDREAESLFRLTCFFAGKDRD